jgi:hypothetical protein
MSLFFLLLVPVLIGLVGLIAWREDITWKELVIQEVVIVVLIVGTFFISAFSKSQDVEIWSGNIVSKDKHSEYCTESYKCRCHEVCSGSGSNRSCSEECDTCYKHWYVTTWDARTSNGEIAYDEGGCYDDRPREPKRFSQIVVGEPTSIEHSYINYIKGNPDTIIKRVSVEKNFSIPAYPEVYDWYRSTRFLQVGVVEPNIKQFNDKLDVLNAELGSKKQVNIIIILTTERDQMYVEKLREVWIGGKKNDFVVVISVPDYNQDSSSSKKIAWSQVMSWTDSEDAKVFTKNRIMELGNLDVDKVLGIIKEEVSNRYVRKEMKDFEYLKARIEPSGLVKTIIAIISIGVSIGLTILFKKEDVA